MKTLSALLAALGMLVAVAGCGETVIDATKTEEQLQSSLQKSLPEALGTASGKRLAKELGVAADTRIESVDCPSGQEVEPEVVFACTVTFANGAEAIENLKILNEDADVEALGLSASK